MDCSIQKSTYLLFLLLAIFWSGSFVAIKAMVLWIPPLLSAMFRIGIALLFLIGLLIFLRKPVHAPFSLRWRLWVTGLFSQGIPFSLLFWGEKHIAPGLAGILNGTVPLWAFMLGLFSPKTRDISPLKCVGLIMGLIGTAVIFGPMLDTQGLQPDVLGLIAILLMAISYAIGSLLAQHLLRDTTFKLDVYTNIYHQHWASFIFVLLLTLFFESWPSSTIFTQHPIIAISALYLGIFSTALGWLIYLYLIREWDAVRASAVMYLVPIMALFWDFLFFHRIPQWTEGFGILIILGSIIFLQWPRSRCTN